jgi:hypothetical protein
MLKILAKLLFKAKTKEFKKKSKNNLKDFTRDRKIDFLGIVTMIMNMMRKSLQIEIDEFIQKFGNKDMDENYTKQAFIKARQKLNPIAFQILNDTIISEFYADGEFKTYKGYRLLAVDGSDLEIPNTSENREIYGCAGNGSGLKLARAKSLILYDIENKLILSSKIDKYSSSERALAKESIDKMLSFKTCDKKNLLLGDRGFPSSEIILYLQEKKIDFLIRTGEKFYKEVVESEGEDQNVIIEINKKRHYDLSKKGVKVELGHKFELRVIKIILDSGEMETLITNLPPEILSIDEANDLYFKRWTIETKFDNLKNKLQIENFSGKTPLTIEQDYYASMLITNLASLISQNAEEELAEKNKNKELKYEYKINQNILYGKLKFNLIELLLEENDHKKTLMYNTLLKDITKNIVPIRNNRHIERTKRESANKYSLNKRFAI